jgi:hypothetical protein
VVVQARTGAPEPRPGGAPACPQPSRSEVVELAVGAGCDCPMVAPDEVGDEYLEPSVENWLTDLEARCPSFAERASQLDCSEFPCMLYVEYRDYQEAMSEQARSEILCNPNAPDVLELQYKGTAQAGQMLYSVLSVRPAHLRGFERREMVRMTTTVPWARRHTRSEAVTVDGPTAWFACRPGGEVNRATGPEP